jgi:hypothetical protein
MWVATGLVDRLDWSRAHRFFSETRWEPDTAGLMLARLVVWLDGMRTAMAWYAETAPELRGRTVAVLVEHSPDAALYRRRAADSLRAVGAQVHLLSYDRSLAAGAPLQPGLLARKTTYAVVRIAAAALIVANDPSVR